MPIIARAHQTISDLNDGRSITAVDVEYYLSTSSSSLVGGAWSTTAPAWVSGKFMWSRTKTTYSTDDPTYSTAACITGAAGSTGATGTGVSSITEEFYLSTSKTTQTGGSWVATPPTWSTGTYMWTRSKIVYTNPSNTVYTTPLCDTGWEATNEIEIGGRNYATNSAWISDTDGWVVATNAARDETYTLNGAACIKSTQSGLSSDSYRGAYMDTESLMPITVGDVLTASVCVRVDDYTTFDSSLAVFIVVLDAAKSAYAQSTVYTYFYPSAESNGKWKRISSTITVTGETAAYARLAFWVRRNGTAWFACPKLERGNKTTDWSQSQDEVRLGSSIALTPLRTILKTPEFLIQITKVLDGENMVVINQNGAYFAIASSPTLAPRKPGGVYKIQSGERYETLADAFSDLEGAVLTEDIVLKLGAHDVGGVLRGVRGGHRVIITSGNLLASGSLRELHSANNSTLAADGSYGYKVIATTAGTYRYVRVLIGRVGDMGLAGKDMSIGVETITQSGGNAILAVLRLYDPTGTTLKSDITSVYASNMSRSGRIPDTAEDGDLVMLVLYTSQATSCTAGAYTIYDRIKVEFGETMFSWPTAQYTISSLEVVGCDSVSPARVILPNGAKVRNSNLVVSRSEIYGDVGIFAEMSHVRLNNNIGTCTKAVDAVNAQVLVTGPAPSGTYVGWDVNTTDATIGSSGTPPVTTTKTITANSTGTYGSSGWWTSDRSVRQGYLNGYRLRGGIWFNAADIPSTATDMKLTLARIYGYGLSSGAALRAYGTVSNARSGEPALTTGPYDLGTSASWGNTKTHALPAELVADLADGTVKGIILYAADTSAISGEVYSVNYARFGGTDGTAPKLAITYPV